MCRRVRRETESAARCRCHLRRDSLEGRGDRGLSGLLGHDAASGFDLGDDGIGRGPVGRAGIEGAAFLIQDSRGQALRAFDAEDLDLLGGDIDGSGLARAGRGGQKQRERTGVDPTEWHPFFLLRVVTPE
jgi:hypothetical protein